MKKRGLVGFVLATGVMLFCFVVFVAEGYAADPIRIGVTSDYSGTTAMLGLRQRDVWKMAVKELNDAGGIKGRPVEATFLDNGMDPAKALSTLKLLKEKYNIVAGLGNTSSTVNIVCKKWGEDNHIPFVTSMALSRRLLQPEGKAWFFRSCGIDTLANASMLKWLKDKGYTKIGVEHTNLVWGTDGLEVIKELAPEYGVQIVGSVGCEPKSKDLSIQAKKLIDTGAEAIIGIEYESECGVWARAMKTIGSKLPVIQQSSTVLNGAIKSNPPELFEGWWTVLGIDPTKPSVKEVWKKYESFSGTRFEAEEIILHWDAIQVLFEAIRLSDNPDDPEAIREGFYKIKNYQPVSLRKGTVAGFSIGKNHLPTAKDYVIGVAKSGVIIPAE